MTDISSFTTHAEVQLDNLPALSSVSLPQPPHGAPRAGSAHEDEEEDYTIKCTCGNIEDDGHTVYCEDCDTWQHVKCYYENAITPEVHRCVDCEPRHIDIKRPLARQKQANGERRVKRTPAKSHKKKTKDTPSAINGWSMPDKDDSAYTADRHSGSPRDQPPPAKRAKTSHRSAHSISANVNTARKRAGSGANFGRSPSKSPSGSPGANGWPDEFYTHEFMQLHRTSHEYTPTEANLHVNINITGKLSTWLSEPSALAEATNGKAPHEVFQRWNKSMDELASPDVKKHVEEDTNRTFYGVHPVWQYLTIESDVAKESYIGELKGHIGQIDDYIKDPANRWSSLKHPAPFVFFHPQLPIYIDTRVEGTLLRYARRSCHPNLRIKTLITEGNDYHFCLFAVEDIPAGSEITVGWELEDKVCQLLATFTSAQTSSNGFRLQGREEEYISRWVNNLLANFGDCACGSPSCAMSRFDKRALLAHLDGSAMETSKVIKTKKQKRTGTQISPLNTGFATNSRSGSEAIKADQEENGDDSRSASSRSKHGSRDNTPMTHFSGDATSGFGTEISKREERKVALSEKIFEKMEQDPNGFRKKKRNSGGSTLTTPSAATSVSIFNNRAQWFSSHHLQKQLGHSELSPSSVGTSHMSGQRYIETGTGSRDNSPLLHPSNSKSAVGARSTQRSNQLSARPAARVYVDKSTQTDPLPHERPHGPIKKKKFIPRVRRLLRDFAAIKPPDAELVHGEIPVLGSTFRNELTSDAMDLDTNVQTDQSVSMPPPAVPVPPQVAHDATTEGIPEQGAEKDPAAASQDVPMQDASTATDVALEPEPETAVNASFETSPDETQQQPAHSRVQSSPPPPGKPTSDPAPASSPPRNNFRATDLHVTLPPTPQFTAPPAQMTGTPSSAFAPPSMLSPMSIPASSSHSHIIPTFPISGTAAGAVTPSPAKKKMSLSDYTKRSKAREVERSSPPAAIPESIKDEAKGFTGASAALQGSAVMDTPAVEKEEPEPPKVPKMEEGHAMDES